MAGGLFLRVKTWISGESIKAADLNDEFDNIIENLEADKLAGTSDNVTEMQVQLSPGDLNSEVPADSIAEEIQQLRFVIARLTGQEFWYQAPDLTIDVISDLLNQGQTIPPNRIVSGKTRTTSLQPIFLKPGGASDLVTLKASPSVPFVYYIANAQYQIEADVTLTGLTAAPSSQNTALINDTALAGAAATKLTGEKNSVLTIDNVGSNFIANTFQAFHVTNGVGNEYFVGYQASATTLVDCFRGYFFDSADAPIPRITVSNNDTITLMKINWIFVNANGQLSATTLTPAFSAEEPTSPSSGQPWFDFSENIWKTYNGSTFEASNSTLIGMAIQNSADQTVAARSFDFYFNPSSQNTIDIEIDSNSGVRSGGVGGIVSVNGRQISFGNQITHWDMPTHLATGLVEASSTRYYVYVSSEGERWLDSTAPYDMLGSKGGSYHPFESWRSLGYVDNNGSSNFSDIFSDRRAPTNYSIGDNVASVQVVEGAAEQLSSTVEIVTKGGPIWLGLVPDESSSAASVPLWETTCEANGTNWGSGAITNSYVHFRAGPLVSDTAIASFTNSINSQSPGGAAGGDTPLFSQNLPVSVCNTVLVRPAGRYSFSAWLIDTAGSVGTSQTTINNARLVAFEIGGY